jgi:hypothetical protein
MSAVVKLPRAYKALDIPITFTHFKDVFAKTKSERELKNFRDLVDVIEQTQAPTKATLPLLSFARYIRRTRFSPGERNRHSTKKTR